MYYNIYKNIVLIIKKLKKQIKNIQNNKIFFLKKFYLK